MVFRILFHNRRLFEMCGRRVVGRNINRRFSTPANNGENSVAKLPTKPNINSSNASKSAFNASSNASSTASSANDAQKSWWQRTWPILLRRGIRAVQIAVIGGTVYNYGYQSGVIAYVQNPEEMDQIHMDMAMAKRRKPVLDTLGVAEPEPDTVVTETDRARVKAIVKRILNSARIMIDQNITEIQKLDQAPHAFEELEKWKKAKKRLNGYWEVVMPEDTSVNAFITQLCPRKVFVYAGLLNKLKPTDDELAFILAHELSHVILDHGGEDDATFRSGLLILQLVVITLIDPFSFSVFFIDWLVNYVRQAFQADYSRDHEIMADDLGLALATHACFDTSKGIEIMQKLAEVTKHADGTYHQTHMLDSHPASIERYERLKAEQVAFQKPNHCKSLMEDLKITGIFTKVFW